MHLEGMQVKVYGEERRTFTGGNMVSGEVACEVVEDTFTFLTLVLGVTS